MSFKALPGRFARVDHRADGFHKIVRKLAALMFGNGVNASRAGQLRLFELVKQTHPDEDWDALFAEREARNCKAN